MIFENVNKSIVPRLEHLVGLNYTRVRLLNKKR